MTLDLKELWLERTRSNRFPSKDSQSEEAKCDAYAAGMHFQLRYSSNDPKNDDRSVGAIGGTRSATLVSDSVSSCERPTTLIRVSTDAK